MENEFKEAILLELSDANVCIRPYELEDPPPGWYEFIEKTGRQYSLPNEKIERFSNLFNFQYIPPADPEDFALALESRVIVGTGSYSDLFGSCIKIKKLSVKVEGPQLLTIQIENYCNEEEVVEEQIQEITYSGNYTVWWKPTTRI